jgi:hypothetical protein
MFKTMLNGLVSLVFVGVFATMVGWTQSSPREYPPMSDPRIRICELKDPPVRTIRHYHCLAPGGYRCYVVQGGETVMRKEYQLPE